MGTTPSLLLVHGAWHGPWAWQQLIDQLSDLDVHTVALPTSGDDPATLGDLYDDAAAVNAAVAAISGPVVVVAHSYGGAPVTQAERVLRINTSHSPFLSRPAELATLSGVNSPREAGDRRRSVRTPRLLDSRSAGGARTRRRAGADRRRCQVDGRARTTHRRGDTGRAHILIQECPARAPRPPRLRRRDRRSASGASEAGQPSRWVTRRERHGSSVTDPGCQASP
ncbi:alpha/beta hydrolase [Catellatospora sp. NPDC049111]|uniref:alpha/beta hydrolase n=1 Tax=Catellatospora sp. NPDC049111 TaxID=3155271 RepID=UPI0033E548DD